MQNLNSENEISDIKYKTVYTIKVTRKAKPIVEISNNVYEIRQKQIIAIVILVILLVGLITTAIVVNKKNKSKKNKYKKTINHEK